MSDVPDEVREAALLALATKFALIESPVNLVVDAVLDAAAPHIRAAERQRLHAVEALCDEAERDKISGMPGAWVHTDRIRAALVSPVSDDTGGTK